MMPRRIALSSFYRDLLQNRTRQMAESLQALEPFPIQLNNVVTNLQRLTEGGIENHEQESLLEAIRRDLLYMVANEERVHEAKDIEHHPEFPSHLCEVAFRLQLLLARCFPRNDKEQDTNRYIDPITMDDFGIEDERNIVVTSSGWLFFKTTLIKYFKRNNAFRHEDAVPLHPMTKEPLHQREIDYLRSQGVTIPNVNEELLSLYHYLGIVEDVEQREVTAANYGLLIGIFLGVIVAVGTVTFGFYYLLSGMLPFYLEIDQFTVLSLIGVIGGTIEKIHGRSFYEGLSSTIWSTGWSFIFLSFLGKWIFAALGYFSLIPVGSPALLLWETIIQPMVLPLSPLLIGLMAEMISSSGYRDVMKNIGEFFHTILTKPFATVSILLFGTLGYATGYVINFLYSSLGRLFRSPVAEPVNVHVNQLDEEGEAEFKREELRPQPAFRQQQNLRQPQEGGEADIFLGLGLQDRQIREASRAASDPAPLDRSAMPMNVISEPVTSSQAISSEPTQKSENQVSP